MKIKWPFALLFSIYSLMAYSSAEVVTTNNYTQVNKLAHDFLGPSKNSVLVVFDIDDTLLHIPNCLPIQAGKGTAYQHWLEMVKTCPAFPTESNTSAVVNGFQKKGIHTIALTARGSLLKERSEEQLKLLDINFLGMPFGMQDNFDEYINSKNKLIFENGVAYAGGSPKGVALKFMLYQKLNRNYKKIVFVDDNIKNINSVKLAFSTDARVEVLVIHYNRYVKNKSKILFEDWEN